jgi:copper(I)-binding protein
MFAEAQVARFAEAAAALQRHEMMLGDGVMRMRELPHGLLIPANATVVSKRAAITLCLSD